MGFLLGFALVVEDDDEDVVVERVEVRVICFEGWGFEEGVWMASYFGRGSEGEGCVVMVPVVEFVETVERVLIERVDEEEGW